MRGQKPGVSACFTRGVRVLWKAVAGSVKAQVGSYSYQALDGGKRTPVTYKLALDLGFSGEHADERFAQVHGEARAS